MRRVEIGSASDIERSSSGEARLGAGDDGVGGAVEAVERRVRVETFDDAACDSPQAEPDAFMYADELFGRSAPRA